MKQFEKEYLKIDNNQIIINVCKNPALIGDFQKRIKVAKQLFYKKDYTYVAITDLLKSSYTTNI